MEYEMETGRVKEMLTVKRVVYRRRRAREFIVPREREMVDSMRREWTQWRQI